MERPEDAVKNLMRISKEFIFSVPMEPIWRMMNLARGKYIQDLGNTSGHIQHFSKRSFKKVLVECGLEVVCWETPLPWLIVYCRKLSNE